MKLLDDTKSKFHGKNINTVVVPPELRIKLATGEPFIDHVLGGGLTPSTCWMLTGDSGCGKTTLALTIANLLTRVGHVVLYNGREESVYQVKMACERLDVNDGFIMGEDVFVDDVISHAKKLQLGLAVGNAKELDISKHRRVIIIADSLQALDSGKYDTGRKTKNTPVQCASSLVGWAKSAKPGEVSGVMMFVNHVTKAGHFAGDNTLLHAVDAHLHLGFDRKQKSDTYGERILTKNKDRFGPAVAPMVVDMGVGGKLTQRVVEEKEEEDDELDEAAE
jgi:predicted ATP-dependent serine protease